MKTLEEGKGQHPRLGQALEGLLSRCRDLVEARPGMEPIELASALASRQVWHLTGPTRLATQAWWSSSLRKLVVAKFSSVWHGPRLMVLGIPRAELTHPLFYALVRGEGGKVKLTVEVRAHPLAVDSFQVQFGGPLQEVRETFRGLASDIQEAAAPEPGLETFHVVTERDALELAMSAVLAYLDRYLDLVNENGGRRQAGAEAGEPMDPAAATCVKFPLGKEFEGNELLGTDFYAEWRAFLRAP